MVTTRGRHKLPKDVDRTRLEVCAVGHLRFSVTSVGIAGSIYLYCNQVHNHTTADTYHMFEMVLHQYMGYSASDERKVACTCGMASRMELKHYC